MISTTSEEDAGLVSLNLDGLEYSPGPNENDQELSYTITVTPDPSIGAVGYLDDANNFTTVRAGESLTLDQLRGLYLQTAQDGYGQTDLSFRVSDNGSAGSSDFYWDLFDQSEILKAEAQTLQDLDADGVVGVNVESELYSPSSYGPDGPGHSDTDRWVYAKNNGLLISRQDIPSSEDASGFNQYTDLRNINYTSDSWSGPGAVLIPTDNLDLDLANVDIVGTRLIRSFVSSAAAPAEVGQQATGFDLYVRDLSSDQVTLYAISLDGTLEATSLLSGVELDAAEVRIGRDLSGNGVAGASITDQLLDRWTSFQGMGNQADLLRNLYDSNQGLVVSRERIQYPGDLRTAPIWEDAWQGPSVLLLRNASGNASFQIPDGFSAVAVTADRNIDSDGPEAVESFTLYLTSDDSSEVRSQQFTLMASLSSNPPRCQVLNLPMQNYGLALISMTTRSLVLPMRFSCLIATALGTTTKAIVPSAT